MDILSFLSTACTPITCHSFNIENIFEGPHLSNFISVQVHLDLSLQASKCRFQFYQFSQLDHLVKRTWWYETCQAYVTQISTTLPPTIMPFWRQSTDPHPSRKTHLLLPLLLQGEYFAKWTPPGEPRKKQPLTFHSTGCLIGILITYSGFNIIPTWLGSIIPYIP